jgi:hypothetical protein
VICRTPAEALAAGKADGAKAPPLTQGQADLIAAILAPHIPAAAQAA